tara:strand:+ start:129 stop:446 length:318 start_codon:yes stop_codon:yes gene_type:complete
MSEQTKEFISGFYPKPRHPKTPEFIFSKGAFNVDQAYEFFKAKKESGEKWVNYQVKAKKGDDSKHYGEVDNWKPEAQQSAPTNETQQAPAALYTTGADVAFDSPF